jgi:P27 family predicted phage terminase small subunit
MGGRGSGGHNRKSKWQHQLEGTYRRDRHGSLPGPNQSEMSADIKPPRWFSPEAKAYFEELAPQLWALGTLDKLDLCLFEGLCVTLANMDALKRIIDSEGEIIKGKRHPLSVTLNRYIEEALRFFRDFGMTPMARRKLGIGKGKHRDIFNLLDGIG